MGKQERRQVDALVEGLFEGRAGLSAFAAMLGGYRSDLITQGFAPDIADSLVVEAAKLITEQARKGANEAAPPA